MKSIRKLNRRSFMARVLGGAVIGSGALMAVAGKGRAHELNDSDSGPTADPAGLGRAAGAYSDTDSGVNADPVNEGTRWGHFTDSDSGEGADPVNHGRRRLRGGRGEACASDSDAGIGADPVCQGRATNPEIESGTQL